MSLTTILEIIGAIIAVATVLVTLGIAYGSITTRMTAHEELDAERHTGVERMFEEIRADIKTLLAR
jgi:hypothetical protein